ncbi:MAG: pilus assembly protein TadG-related protein [Acidimicrobiia bacterium]|nr:pilus assembly protein TadG-related protein [Acidimicrobiia bacterium]
MRISRLITPATWPRRVNRERGASLVLVSGALVAFVAIAAMAVDFGQLVVQRRAMVTATDAASLAAATIMAEGGDATSACVEARVYLDTNAPNHDPTTFGCDAVTRPGIVEVEAAQIVPYGFATVFGISSGTAHSSTAAEYLRPVEAGIRPFMLCRVYNNQFENWLDGTTPTPPTIQFLMSDNLQACLVDQGDGAAGGNSGNGGGNGAGGNGGGGNGGGGGGGNGGGGNWAVADLDGQSNGTPETRGWIAEGYDGVLNTCQNQTCPPPETVCTDDPVACYEGSPGVLSVAVRNELDSITDNGTISLIPIVREVTEGNGGNLQFRVDELVYAELVAYQTLQQADIRSLSFRFIDPDDLDLDPAVRICGAVIAECP